MEKKNIYVVFFVLLAFILTNYFYNVITYSGKDIVDMYHPMKLLLLSDNSGYGFYFMQIYPLLVVIPAGFSYASDKGAREVVFIQSRLGAKNYYYGKLITVFLATFFVFTIPFLIEIVLNCIAFPLQATGDPSNVEFYSSIYMEGVKNYMFYGLYLRSGYLYTVYLTLLFGTVSGILAVFTVAVSTFPMRFKVLLFLPVYVLLNALGILNQTMPWLVMSTSYFDYLRIFNWSQKSEAGYLVLILMLFLISIMILSIKSRKDSL